MAEAQRATPAVPAKKNPSPQVAPPRDLKKNPLTSAEEEAKKAADEGAKIEAAAAEKAGKINGNLIKDGSPRRIMGGVRNGKPVFHWGNFVPTQELTEEELEAAESMK